MKTSIWPLANLTSAITFSCASKLNINISQGQEKIKVEGKQKTLSDQLIEYLAQSRNHL